MTTTTTRARRLLALAGAAVLLTAACSTEQEIAGGGGGGGKEECRGAERAQARLTQVWHDAQEQLGLPQKDPTNVQVCEVDTSEYQTEPPYTIAFASQGPTNSWALSSDAYVRYQADQLGVELLYASASGDAANQVGNIQDLLAQDPDALIVQPMSTSITGQVERAMRMGIPAVVCTGLLPNTDVVSTVNRSYDLQGRLWAQWVIEQLDGEGQVAMLSGIAGVPTAEQQYQAAKKVFEQQPGIEIVTHQYTDWSPTKAKQVAATLVVQHPEVDAIWSDSAISDIGVIQAYTEAGKPVPPVTGDSSNGFLRLAEEHDVAFALSAYPPEQCGQAVQVAVDILEGKPVLSRVPVESAVYTNAQLDEYYRPDCTDNLWVPSQLPDEVLTELELC